MNLILANAQLKFASGLLESSIIKAKQEINKLSLAGKSLFTNKMPSLTQEQKVAYNEAFSEYEFKGCERASEENYPEYYSVVKEAAERMGEPMPNVFVSIDPDKSKFYDAEARPFLRSVVFPEDFIQRNGHNDAVQTAMHEIQHLSQSKPIAGFTLFSSASFIAIMASDGIDMKADPMQLIAGAGIAAGCALLSSLEMHRNELDADRAVDDKQGFAKEWAKSRDEEVEGNRKWVDKLSGEGKPIQAKIAEIKGKVEEKWGTFTHPSHSRRVESLREAAAEEQNKTSLI